MWDFVAHQIVPIFVITIFSIGLFLRVLWRKNRMRLAVNWRAHRKMTIQALSISSMYCIILLPYTIVYILRNIYNIRNPLIEDFYDCTVFFSYFVILLFPFVCACSLPQLKVRVKNLFCLSQNRRQIVPISWCYIINKNFSDTQICSDHDCIEINVYPSRTSFGMRCNGKYVPWVYWLKK